MKMRIAYLSLIPAAMFFFACSSGTGTDESSNSSTKDTTAEEKVSHAQIVFYNIPSPLETSQLLVDAGAKYDAAYTNNPLNSKQYKTTESQALNLGVYGSDLSFAGIFQNAQECMSFLKSINGLSADLGIGEAFNEKTAARLESNKDNKDSLLSIISNSFWEADSYLKENNRAGISSLLIAGGWIEGMFIASKVYQKTKSEKIKNRIANEPQMNALVSIISLLESEKTISSSQTDLMNGLKELKSSFDKISFSKSETKASTDAAKHITKLQTTSDTKISEETLNEIIKAVESLRGKIISMK